MYRYEEVDYAKQLFVLGLSPWAPVDEPKLRRAYKRKAIEVHPDRGGSHEKAVAVNLAFERLSPLVANGRTFQVSQNGHQQTYGEPNPGYGPGSSRRAGYRPPPPPNPPNGGGGPSAYWNRNQGQWDFGSAGSWSDAQYERARAARDAQRERRRKSREDKRRREWYGPPEDENEQMGFDF